jgi:hypothetical protein
MWGKRQERYVRLSRRRALGLLAEIMARAEEREASGEPEGVLEPLGTPASFSPISRPHLRAADVPQDTGAEPEPPAFEQDVAPLGRSLPVQRTGENAYHDSQRALS